MLWWVALVPILLAPAVYAAGAAGRRLPLALAAAAAMAATLALAAGAAAGGWTATYTWSDLLVLRAGLDPIAALVALLVPAVALPIVVYAAFHEAEEGLSRLVALLVFFAGSMELLVIAADLLTLLVGWELVGASSWALIAHEWREAHSPRDAAVAFLTTRFGDLGLFLAAAAAFAATGSLAYADLPALSGTTLHIFAFGIVLAAAAKSAQLPFSPWLFAAMSGPVSVSALLHAATMVAAGAYLIARLEGVLSAAGWFAPAAVALGLATALAGGLVASLHAHAKKLLAASTSAHYGLMWVAAGAGYPAAAALHLVTHAFFKALLFLAAGVAGARAGGFELHRMRLGRTLPWAAAAAAVGTLALAGVPPLGGAWSKEAVVTAAGQHATWAAVLAALAGGASALYAVRFQLLAFGGGARSAGAPVSQSERLGQGSRARGGELADPGTPFGGDAARADPASVQEAGEAGPPSGDERADLAPPSHGERGALLALAAVTAALSLLGWPGARGWVSAQLASEVPPFKAWEIAVSLALVAAGGLVGWAAARRAPDLGRSGLPAAMAAWLAIPRLTQNAIVRPGLAACHALARFDDRAVDAGVRAAAHIGERAARLGARFDDVAVDAGVRAAAHLGERAARVGALFDLRGFDASAEGVSRWVDAAGRAARRAQTGLAHQYYAGITAGVAIAIAVLALYG